jgi:hypothetical protein
MFQKPNSDLIPVLNDVPQVQEIQPLEDIPVEMEITDKPQDDIQEEAILPELDEKTQLQQDEIFVAKTQKRPKTPVRSRSPEKVITGGGASPLKEKPKLTKSGRKPRKPMSEEHKAKLAEARKKAMAVRKANKAKRDEEKAQKKTISQQKKEAREQLQAEREEKKLQAEIKKARDENELMEAEARNLQRQKNLVSVPNEISKEVIEELMFQGIMKYDTLRKKQKAEKRARLATEAREQQITNTIRKSAGLPPRPSLNNNPYAHCFSFH